jgi:large subunit ribosomal protein L18
MKLSRNEARKKRKIRIRKKVFGSPERPRLVVFRSNRHIYAQIIDDVKGHTLAAYSSLNLGENVTLTKETAKKVGMGIAKIAREKNIEKVVFDRNGYLYHGRVKALADGAREGGLKF